MTKREAAIVSAFTGIMTGAFSDMHEYINKIMGRPVFTHEMADKALWVEIKIRAKPDFMNLEVM
jgi:hypothetical protein